MLSILSLAILKGISRLVYVYQYTLSPDHGVFKGLFPNGVCRYSPTCSEYAQQAIKVHGWRGLLLACNRLLHCHPFAGGGYDPVALKSTHKHQGLFYK